MLWPVTDMKRFLLIYLALAATLIGSENIPPGPQKTPLLFINATIHPVSRDPIPGGQLLVVDGKITGLAPKDSELPKPEGTQTIDLAGKHIYPGMIAANSVLGLTEINAVNATVDVAEPGRLNPNARAQVSINPDSELLPVTRANGVLSALVIPRSGGGGLIAGTSALVRMDGWTWEEMTVSSPAGLHIYWPNLRIDSRWTTEEDSKKLDKLREDYDKDIQELTDAFAAARAYARARQAPEGSKVPTDLRWESMIPVFEGKLRVFIHAETAPQIQSALHFTATEKLPNPIIVGGRDAWRMSTELLAQHAAVILGPTNDLPLRRWEAYDSPFTAAVKLHAAGVKFCIANDGETFGAANERNLPYQAARAVAHGLPPGEGLKAVTLYPAEILGVADRLGSLEAGKEATFFVSNGDPLEIVTTVERAFVRGREIDLSSKHTRLYDKYREKYRQLSKP